MFPLAFAVPQFLIGPLAGLLVAAGLIVVGKLLHFLIRKLADFLESKTSDQDRKDAIERLANQADAIVKELEDELRPALSAAAGDLLSNGKLTPQGQAKLKIAAVNALKDREPEALQTLKDAGNLSLDATRTLLSAHIEAAVVRNKQDAGA